MNKAKHLPSIVLSTILVLVIVFAALYLNSYSIALQSAGFDLEKTVLIDMGLTGSDKTEYRVVAEYPASENAKVAYLSKEPGFSFWKVDYTVDTPLQTDTGMLELYWSAAAGGRTFTALTSSDGQFEYHELYHGNNATKQISIPQDLLPENTAVSIQQTGSEYLIHFIWYGEMGLVYDIDCYSLLQELGCIA